MEDCSRRTLRRFLNTAFVFIIVLGGFVVFISDISKLSKKPTPASSPHSELVEKKMLLTVRLERLTLLPNEGTAVSVPSAEYLEKLNEVCENKEQRDAQVDCKWHLGQIRVGYNDITSRINPIYGRPTFTEEQRQYIRWSEGRILQLLQGFEYQFIQA